MIRAIAQQAEAERARRAKIINAEAEMQAATMLTEAARILATEEQALQLRYLQTLKEISNERTNTIVFPLPLEMLETYLKKSTRDSNA
jgi:regulator of protease activity HflC (stomatin/prohibitin superfamily)